MSAKAWAVGGALAVIIALLALPLLLPTKWEYRIVAIPDPVFTQAMNIGGAQGWEAILARRAVDSDSDEASYEVIFKRPARRGEPMADVIAAAVSEVRQIAEQGGYAPTQHSLGDMYANGHGVPEDSAEAVRWYRMAAEQGYAPAQYSLGGMYRRGNVNRLMWLILAAENGHAEAASDAEMLIEVFMSAAGRDLAVELAQTCMASGYEDCGR